MKIGTPMLHFSPGGLRVVRIALVIAALVLLALGLASGELDLTRIESGTL